MALYLSIAGVNYEVIDEGAEELESERQGIRRRAFSGQMRSSEQREFRSWKFPLVPMSDSDLNMLRANVALGKWVQCGGAFIGAMRNCTVRVSTAPFIYKGVTYERGVTVFVAEAE